VAPRCITLLTDFGTADGYVGEVKGVLHAVAPGVTVVDISHDIAPQDIDGARLALARYWRRFPEGTVHMVVVDPGVGTTRAAIAVASGGRFLVGPDNGVLSPALFALDAQVVSLATTGAISATFHGRDLFAPVAGQLALDTALSDLGETMHAPVRRRTPEPVHRTDVTVDGIVLSIDRFGNVITNLTGLHARNHGVLMVRDVACPLRRTYADVEVGTLLCLTGSSGLLEIAQRDGNAAHALQLQRGAGVRWVPRPRTS
jgi:S-adenosylmethionine hydrolase